MYQNTIWLYSYMKKNWYLPILYPNLIATLFYGSVQYNSPVQRFIQNKKNHNARHYRNQKRILSIDSRKKNKNNYNNNDEIIIFLTSRLIKLYRNRYNIIISLRNP